MHETTVKIPVSMAAWIKDQGMTYAGAFRQGIRAMQERKTWNEELAGLQKNLNSYRERMIKAEQRLRELGQKVDAE